MPSARQPKPENVYLLVCKSIHKPKAVEVVCNYFSLFTSQTNRTKVRALFKEFLGIVFWRGNCGGLGSIAKFQEKMKYKKITTGVDGVYTYLCNNVGASKQAENDDDGGLLSASVYGTVQNACV
ncbi:unnamed protein product [Orchesella dallaii]|uniref:Uncharacterized protein n=1 Tax=Orchesella dallaii TaxID=48710 RepID=A0ABP1QZN2_9HEXA